MPNPKEKHFLIVSNNDSSVNEKFKHFIENELKSNIPDKKYHYSWQRLWGGRFYTLGTLENTLWTVDKLTKKIETGVPNVGQFLVLEVQNTPMQGLMTKDFWNYLKEIDDLTLTLSNDSRSKKLKKLKSLLDKKDELKRKEELLKTREKELLKKKELIDQEAILLEKEKELKQMEDELLNREKNIQDELKEVKTVKEEEPKKRSKFLGIF